MKFLKVIILVLVLLNLPSYYLVNGNSVIGTLLSYSTFLLIIIYYLVIKTEILLIPFIVIGFFYFSISFLVDIQSIDVFFVTLFKYFIFIVMGATIVKDVKLIDIYIVLLVGSVSILYDAVFVTDLLGRFSGFYLNPNLAGCICIFGFALSFSVVNRNLQRIGQLLFSVAGFLTFSRTFLLIWVLINIMSLAISLKNGYKILIGVLVFGVLVSFGEEFGFNTLRLEAFSALLEGKVSNNLEEDSRTETWAAYYDKICESPFFGNGYLSFSGKSYGAGENANSVQGVHNTFLMILGESGIFVFFYFASIYWTIILKGLRIFKSDPLIFLFSFTLIMYMLTNHNYFDNYIILFASMWIYILAKKDELVINSCGEFKMFQDEKR